MSWRYKLLSIFAIMVAGVLLRHGIEFLQSSPLLWLIAVVIAVPWVVWYSAHQLYVAAKYGYVLTGVPERRVYRHEDPRLFRNNVVAYIVLWPMFTAGAVLILLEALKGQHLIE